MNGSNSTYHCINEINCTYCKYWINILLNNYFLLYFIQTKLNIETRAFKTGIYFFFLSFTLFGVGAAEEFLVSVE